MGENDIKKQLSSVAAIFPLPIYKTNIVREFTKEEQDELDVIISEQLTEFYGEESIRTKNISIDRYLLNRKSFLSIHSFIQHHLKEFATTVLGIDATKTNWSPHITQSWLNVYKPGHYEPPHRHYNCIISGAFYINCLKNLPHDKPDGIVFAPTSHSMLEQLNIDRQTVQDTIFSDKPCHTPVVNGDLVLFPSSTQHVVTLNETSNQNRISLSFNST